MNEALAYDLLETRSKDRDEVEAAYQRRKENLRVQFRSQKISEDDFRAAVQALDDAREFLISQGKISGQARSQKAAPAPLRKKSYGLFVAVLAFAAVAVYLIWPNLPQPKPQAQLVTPSPLLSPVIAPPSPLPTPAISPSPPLRTPWPSSPEPLSTPRSSPSAPLPTPWPSSPEPLSTPWPSPTVSVPTPWRSSPEPLSTPWPVPARLVTPPASLTPYAPLASSSPSSVPSEGEVFPQTRQRLLKDADVEHLNFAQLRYAINEMYARYGATFSKAPEIEKQFRRFEWYDPKPRLSFDDIDNLMSDIEKENVKLLARYRDQNNNPDHSSVFEQGRSPALEGERYPQTRKRLLAEDDVKNLSYAQLRYAINEMYARHGATFPKAPEIERQFRRFSWYLPNPRITFDDIDNSMSDIEKENVKLLARYRDQKSPQ